ncbi:42686_t:CDS:2 [Gigaspora margarita]|uniref:42686_t:CDS:1 n=1 Tax=Gigaspora margarita TaxID=4874 RepID=A0ABM8W3P0_GIGMA|nr:42686_t:CDS:2 [Gigaspora margarita]
MKAQDNQQVVHRLGGKIKYLIIFKNADEIARDESTSHHWC